MASATEGNDPRSQPSPEVEAELRARRARLESRTHKQREREVAAEVIAVRRGTALLGVPIEQVVEFRRAPVTPVPGVPATIVGLFQIRGYVHCCVDLLPISSKERAPSEAHTLLIGVVDTPRGPLGIRFDEVLGPRTVYGDELDENLQRSSGPVVAMVTRDLLEVIDVRRLCERPDIHIAASTVDR
ncbi:MAG: chemotaxis protein CheW [Enhygromyxa sp.]